MRMHSVPSNVSPQWAAPSLGFERATTDWRKVVDDPEVEVVANLASTDAHAEPCIAALAAGKAVLCEKPLASDTNEALAMRAAATAAAAPAACGFNYRYVPAVRLAQEIISAGRIGPIFPLPGPHPPELGPAPT